MSFWDLLIKSTRIVFVRHGLVLNPKEEYYGTKEGYPLSEDGITTVRRLGNVLLSREIKPDVIYASPTERTKDTALILSEIFGLASYIIDNRIIDTYNPAWEGKNFNEIDYNERDPGYEYEEPSSVFRRGSDFVQDVLYANQGRTIFVVSHEDVIRATISWMGGERGNLEGISRFSQLSRKYALKQGEAYVTNVTYGGRLLGWGERISPNSRTWLGVERR